jgi:DivIVA domain-containing protein
MALTPEDVVNKRFQPTKFREGYDQDEVDDFLDEVVVELRRLNQENEELRSRLVASDAKMAELQRAGAQSPPPPTGFEQPAVAAAPAPIAAPVPAPAAAIAPAAVAQYVAPESDPSMDPSNTNNLLQLARRLHEEHVREGVEKKEALIAEGQATAARTVDEANTTASHTLEEAKANAAQALEDAQANAARVISEAQEKQRAQLGALDQERQSLEGRIDELRTFEREYRQKLKGYIEGQLRDLDSTAAVLQPVGAPAAASAASAPSVSAPAPAQNFGSPVAPPPANYPGFAGN